MGHKRWIGAASLLALAATPIYRWVDGAGNAHSSDRAPPPGYAAEAAWLENDILEYYD